jgi:hypothetical protein
MIHLSAFALCLAGFTTLAFATRRQQRDIVGRSLPLITVYVLRAAGTCALLSALGILVASYGWGLGLVTFSGHTSMTAAVVLCVLIGYARTGARSPRHRRAAVQKPRIDSVQIRSDVR